MDDIPQPYHRWAANEDMDVRAFSMKDRCLSCGVTRQSHLTGTHGVMSDAVAAGGCPQRPWREMSDEERKAYLIAYIDEPVTQSQREMLSWAQS